MQQGSLCDQTPSGANSDKASEIGLEQCRDLTSTASCFPQSFYLFYSISLSTKSFSIFSPSQSWNVYSIRNPSLCYICRCFEKKKHALRRQLLSYVASHTVHPRNQDSKNVLLLTEETSKLVTSCLQCDRRADPLPGSCSTRPPRFIPAG